MFELENSSVVSEVRVQMATMRVADVRAALRGRSDPAAQRLLKAIAKLGPKAKITVRMKDLQAPGELPPSGAAPAAPTVSPSSVASIGSVEPAEPETEEAVTLTAKTLKKK